MENTPEDIIDQTIYTESLKINKKLEEKLLILNSEYDCLKNKFNNQSLEIEKLRAKCEMLEIEHLDQINDIITSFNIDLTVIKRLNTLNSESYTHRQKFLLNEVIQKTISEMFRSTRDLKDDLPF